MIKFIIFDIDGTLVDDEKVLSKNTKEVLKTLKDQGIKLGLASGRQIKQYHKQVSSWGSDLSFDMYVGLNGAELYDVYDKEYRSFYKLKINEIKEIVDVMTPFVKHEYYKHGDMIRYDDDITSFKDRKLDDCLPIDDIYDLKIDEIGKVLYHFDLNKAMEIERFIDVHINECHKDYHGFKTQPGYLEFSNIHTSKAVPMIYYANKHQIDMSEVMALGDTTNDNAMIEASGVGVCLKNGTDDTKKIADIITEYTNNEEGAYRFLKDYFK